MNKGKVSIAPSSWANGFEALGTLDTNFDGQVSGEELKTLSLWFDYNRDAISDEGEVKSLAELGVSVLYYKNPKVDPLSKDIGLEIGFERVVNGKSIKGKSVDWYGDSAKSPQELISNKLIVASSIDTAVSNSAEVKVSNAGKASSSQDPIISGVWEWKSAVNSGGNLDVFGGVLVLNGDGVNLKGYSFAERSIEKKNQSNIASEVGVFKILGQKVSKGNYVFNSAASPNNIETKISVARNGQELEGETTIFNKAGNLSYKWVAKRR